MTRGTLIYISQRFVLIALTALIVSSVVFLGVHRLPGNAFLSERRSTPQREAELLHHYGLDLPLPQQYLNWLGGVLHGDLGESLVNRGVRITPLLLRELRVSATLGLFAMLFTVLVGMALGILAAIKQNTWVDYVASFSGTVGYSMPNFVTATLLILLTVTGFYAWTGGAFYEDRGWGKPEQIIVPAIALGLYPTAIISRLTRASMLEVIRQDYVRTAWAKGLKSRVVVIRHALRNALIPVITILGIQVAQILGGTVIFESIFGLPGMGRFLFDAINQRDYPVIQGVNLLIVSVVVVINLIVDAFYAFLDPRIRY